MQAIIDAGIRRFIGFIGIGAFGTLAHYALMALLMAGFGVAAVAASLAGSLLGALINYLGNYHLNFQSTTAHSVALPRFLGLAVLSIIANAFLMSLFVTVIGIPAALAQLLATGTVVLMNYALAVAWVFARDE